MGNTDLQSEQETAEQARCVDAEKLANLIYDIYKEERIRQNESDDDDQEGA